MEGKLSPGILLIIAILATVFFIIGLLNLLVQTLLQLRGASRRRRQVGEVDDAAGEADGSPTAFQGQLGQLFRLHDAGVDQAFIDALPVFPYRAVVAARRNKDPSFDCAVCLCEFELDDALRLLPTCGHAFHVPCIDAWLLSHSTCPLCRGSVLAECAPASSPFLLVLKSDSVPAERDGSDPGDGGSEESPKADEQIVEIKLGKLRCVDGNVSARVDGTSTITGYGSGNLGQRRSLSMGSYEYITDDHAVLRVAVKTTPKRRPANSRSRRRHALSECDFGGSNSKKGAWEAAVREAAASADAGRCAASLNRDSFSVSKIWMVSSRNEDTGASELAGSRRAVSFRSPAMAAGWKKHLRGETGWDVEAAASRGSSTVSPLSQETALHRAAGEDSNAARWETILDLHRYCI